MTCTCCHCREVSARRAARLRMNEAWLRAVVETERAPGREPLAFWAPVLLMLAIAVLPAAIYLFHGRLYS